MAENKTKELTPEEIKAQKEAQEKAAKAEAAKKLEAKIKAAQTREDVLETGKDGKPTKTKSVKSDYLPEVRERHLYHIELDSPAFDPKTGKKLSKARVQMFKKAEYKMFIENAHKLGLETKVLWNPVKYESE